MHDNGHVISLKESRPPAPPEPSRGESPSPRVLLRPKRRTTHARTRRALLAFVVVVLCGSLFASARWYFAVQDTPTNVGVPSVSEEDSEDIIDRIAHHIELPEGETPTAAVVSDLTKLAGQPFFARAKVGDVVLLYAQAKKAILYDPVADRIIEVGPIQ